MCKSVVGIGMDDLPASLIVALAVQLSCQAFKVVYYSLRERRFQPRLFFSSGKMPSAHSAFVTALTVSVGIRNGFSSDLFAVAAVFAFIIIHDALRVRGALQRLIRILQEQEIRGTEELPADIGHSVPEVVTGIAVGLVLGAGLSVLL